MKTLRKFLLIEVVFLCVAIVAGLTLPTEVTQWFATVFQFQ